MPPNTSLQCPQLRAAERPSVMWKSPCRVAVGFLFLACAAAMPAGAQVTADIIDGSTRLSVTVWKGHSSSSGTMLLVPGWSGGPTDVLGVGEALAAAGMDAVVLSPRGWHQSTGQAGFQTVIEDIRSAVNWIRTTDQFEFNTSHVFLGGHSWGGGMSLIYASTDNSLAGVVSMAGTDHGPLVDRYMEDPEYARRLDGVLESTSLPAGPIRFDVATVLQEMLGDRAAISVVEHAPALAGHSILILGGWEDATTTIDDNLLPYYRALKNNGAADVTFIVYHTDHSFSNVRSQLYTDLLAWVSR